ncbi:hypothetical protein L1987_08530 [Smallanthus sonchifolius]|uniref:Uncharacterized protein n=1 Tax=Smallanthus sonchifolius TaxID=185202 RepID=A0ACB9JKH4_9ASTR|nr:hypothetical protein L1987_08530 [Smallanthus sonchifolius]
MMMWNSSPKIVLLLKKLGEELMEQAKEKIELFQDLAPLLWNSFCTIVALLQVYETKRFTIATLLEEGRQWDIQYEILCLYVLAFR